MTENLEQNFRAPLRAEASRRVALKVAGVSAALVAGGVNVADAAPRSGGRRVRPVTGARGGGAASSALMQVPVRYSEPCVRLELKGEAGAQPVALQDRPARTLSLLNLPVRLSIVNEGNVALPVGTRLLVRARAQDPQNGLMREPATALRVVGGRSVGASGMPGASVLVAPLDALNLDALHRGQVTGSAGSGTESVLELRTAIPVGRRLGIQLEYRVASGVAGSALRQVHVNAALDMAAAGMSREFYEVQSPAVTASLA